MEITPTPVPENEQNETSIFSAEDFDVDIYDKHIRQARNAIFATAGVLTLNLIILMATYPKKLVDYIWIDITLWGVFIFAFIALGFWTKKKPFYAIITALILYGVFILINALLDVSSLYRGIIFKIVVISYLIKSLSDAREAQQMQAFRQ